MKPNWSTKKLGEVSASLNKKFKINNIKTEYQRYTGLLEVILDNAKNLHFAGARLLEHNQSRPFAQFFLYSCLEECGKFLIVVDQYPKTLVKAMLYKAGFCDHKKKLIRLLNNKKLETGLINPKINAEIMAKVIREKLREESLYVDFKNEPIMPTFTNSKQVLDNLVKSVNSAVKFCEIKLDEFKKDPKFNL